jgi:hypothetical protein
MSNVTIFMVDDFDGTMIEWVKIEDDNGSFVCMAKSSYNKIITSQKNLPAF